MNAKRAFLPLCLLVTSIFAPCLAHAGEGGQEGKTEKEFLSSDLSQDTAEHRQVLALDRRDWRFIVYCKFTGNAVKLLKSDDLNSVATFLHRRMAIDTKIENDDEELTFFDWDYQFTPKGKTYIAGKKIKKPHYYSDFPITPGTIFGGCRYVWELGIWQGFPSLLAKKDCDYIIREYGILIDPLPAATVGKYVLINSKFYAAAENARKQMEERKLPTRTAPEDFADFVDDRVVAIEDRRDGMEDGEFRLFFSEDTGILAAYYALWGDAPRNVRIDSYWLIEPSLDVFAVTADFHQEKYKEIARFLDELFVKFPDAPGIIKYPHSYHYEPDGDDDDDDDEFTGNLPPPGGETAPCRALFPESVTMTLTLHPGQVIGKDCRIWELKIWEELGKHLRQAGKPYYLFTGETYKYVTRDAMENDKRPVRPLEQVEPKYCLKIDLPLYEKMERLRQRMTAPQSK